VAKQGMMYGGMLENFQMPKEACLMIGLNGRFVSITQYTVYSFSAVLTNIT
jgi:hypothetical protein